MMIIMMVMMIMVMMVVIMTHMDRKELYEGEMVFYKNKKGMEKTHRMKVSNM